MQGKNDKKYHNRKSTIFLRYVKNVTQLDERPLVPFCYWEGAWEFDNASLFDGFNSEDMNGCNSTKPIGGFLPACQTYNIKPDSMKRTKALDEGENGVSLGNWAMTSNCLTISWFFLSFGRSDQCRWYGNVSNIYPSKRNVSGLEWS